MKVEKMHMNTNARIVSKVLTRNRNTFYALKELINNSIQADSTCIEIMGAVFHIQNFVKAYWN